MVTGSRNINNAWYYFDGSGEMLTGWQYYLELGGTISHPGMGTV